MILYFDVQNKAICNINQLFLRSLEKEEASLEIQNVR
jgi:hypothetical protein